jgi:hypothetical protein
VLEISNKLVRIRVSLQFALPENMLAFLFGELNIRVCCNIIHRERETCAVSFSIPTHYLVPG